MQKSCRAATPADALLMMCAGSITHPLAAILPMVYAGSLLEQAESLLDMGIHPLRIAEGYEMACKVATAHLESIATKWDFNPQDIEPLVQTCMTTLSSKV